MKADVNVARDLLLASLLSGGSYSEFPPEAQERFQLLGSGSFRTAYLDRESQVVYKIDNPWASGQKAGGNKMELQAIEAGQDLLPLVTPDGTEVRLPEAVGFRIGDRYVVAMEYVPRQSSGAVGDYYQLIQDWFGVTDSYPGSGNVREDDDGVLVLTDCGLTAHPSERKEHDCDTCYHTVADDEAPHVTTYDWAA